MNVSVKKIMKEQIVNHTWEMRVQAILVKMVHFAKTEMEVTNANVALDILGQTVSNTMEFVGPRTFAKTKDNALTHEDQNSSR